MTVLVDSWAWLEYFFGSAAGEKAGKIIEDERQRKIVSKINLFEVYCKSLKNEGAAIYCFKRKDTLSNMAQH